MDAFFELIQSVKVVKDVMQNTTCEPDVVDVFLFAEKETELEYSEPPLDSTEKAFNVLPHALQPPAEPRIL